VLLRRKCLQGIRRLGVTGVSSSRLGFLFCLGVWMVVLVIWDFDNRREGAAQGEN
jgi:hypothetical protein